VYTNKHLHLSLTVVEDDEQRLKILNELFHNDTNAYGKGINNLYKYVTTKYINITRQHIKNFVSTKNDYQITEPITKRTNKPIISKYPNELWATDLIFLEYASTNRQWKYIMTVVDVFSRRCWLRKLKTKDATHTRDALEGIIRQEKVSPKFLLSITAQSFSVSFKSIVRRRISSNSLLVVTHPKPIRFASEQTKKLGKSSIPFGFGKRTPCGMISYHRWRRTKCHL
jgi:hypothetical protein